MANQFEKKIFVFLEDGKFVEVVQKGATPKSKKEMESKLPFLEIPSSIGDHIIMRLGENVLGMGFLKEVEDRLFVFSNNPFYFLGSCGNDHRIGFLKNKEVDHGK